MENYIERIKLEEAELKDRTLKLIAFMESDEFGKLDDTEKRLLRMQYAAMETYLSALGSRLAYDGLKRYQSEAQEFCKRIPRLQAAGWTDKEIGDMMPQLNLDTSKAFPSLLFYSLIAANREPATASK